MKPLLAATALALTLAACSQAPGTGPDTAPSTDATIVSPSTEAAPPTPAASATAARASGAASVLALEGLGDLRLGQAVPADSRWTSRGAQASDACATVTSPDYPGVYAIVESGQVRRITLGQRSSVKLAEGIGVGATEAQVRADFAGFRATPHKYVAAPGKYLTAPGGSATDPALRFEIDAAGKVSAIHVGLMPQLEYVEGCS